MRPNIRYSLAICLSFALVGVLRAQERSVSFMRLGTDIIQKKLTVQPAAVEDRAPTLRRLFKTAGCGQRILQQPVPDSGANLLCSVPGTGNSIIVVGAALDYRAKGDEEAVRWGDLTMLPLLAESLNSVVTRHSIVFVAFSGKNGEEGAKAYVERLTPEQRSRIDAVVALDELGRTEPVYSIPGTGPGVDIHTGRAHRVNLHFNPDRLAITRPIVQAAGRWGQDVPKKTGEDGASLIKPFYREHLPVITFTSPSWIVLRYVGDQPIRDYRTKLDLDSYQRTYLFLATYLLFLDRDMGAPPPVPVENVEQVIRDTRIAALQTTAENRRTALPPTLPRPPSTEAAAPTQVARAESTPAATGPVLSADSTPVFRATTRLVQVDVVATDSHGRPISGLQRDDFTILQDGRPQKARVFESHFGSPPAQPAPHEQTAKPHYLNSYSNALDPAANRSWTIILFDMLNTPTADQQIARNQLKRVAGAIPAGQPVALFALTSRLVMVQPFTTDNGVFMASVKNLDLWHSQVLTTEAERQHQVGDVVYRAKTMTDVAIPVQGNVPASLISDFQNDTTNRLLLSTREMESLQVDQRAMFTLDAFEGISRAIAGYPGRKNVIWLSGNFPISILPNNSTSDKWRFTRDYTQHLTRTVTLLSESRVAVYPVDIRGMQMRGIDISTSSAQSAAFVGGNSGTTGLTSADKTSDLLADQTFTAANERETMMEVAEQTGGRAFLNTNDFADAVKRAIEDGSSYYTLAYTPDNEDDKPVFHRIEVKLDRPDIKLSYRRGYYSEPEPGTREAGFAALKSAVQPGMPPSTMMFFTATVKTPDANRKTVELDYVINPSNVTLADVPGGKHVVIDCLAVAFDKEGKEVAHASDTLDGTLPANAVEEQLRGGLPASQQLELKPGVYIIRIGVMDRASQSIGTVSASVEVK